MAGSPASGAFDAVAVASFTVCSLPSLSLVTVTEPGFSTVLSHFTTEPSSSTLVNIAGYISAVYPDSIIINISIFKCNDGISRPSQIQKFRLIPVKVNRGFSLVTGISAGAVLIIPSRFNRIFGVAASCTAIPGIAAPASRTVIPGIAAPFPVPLFPVPPLPEPEPPEPPLFKPPLPEFCYRNFCFRSFCFRLRSLSYSERKNSLCPARNEHFRPFQSISLPHLLKASRCFPAGIHSALFSAFRRLKEIAVAFYPLPACQCRSQCFVNGSI